MRPPVLLQQVRDLAEQAVTGEMAAAVVDVLELVEVEQDQSERARRDIVQLALQPRLECPSIGRPVSQSCDA